MPPVTASLSVESAENWEARVVRIGTFLRVSLRGDHLPVVVDHFVSLEKPALSLHNRVLLPQNCVFFILDPLLFAFLLLFKSVVGPFLLDLLHEVLRKVVVLGLALE